MKNLARIFMICLFLAITSCHVRIQYPGEQPSNMVIKHSWRHYWMWGLIGQESFELYDDCAEGRPYQIYIYSSLPQGVLSVISLGLYVPRTVKITCSGQVEQYEKLKPNLIPKPPLLVKPPEEAMKDEDVQEEQQPPSENKKPTKELPEPPKLRPFERR